MTDSLIQPVASSLINASTGKRVKRVEKWQEGMFLPLLAPPLMVKVLVKGVLRTLRGYKKSGPSGRNF